MEALLNPAYIKEKTVKVGGESGKQNVLFPRSRNENTVGSAFDISQVQWYVFYE